MTADEFAPSFEKIHGLLLQALKAIDAHTGGVDVPHELQPARKLVYDAFLEASPTTTHQVVTTEQVRRAVTRMAEDLGLEPPRWDD